MDTGLEFKPLEDVAAGDRGARLLEAAYPGLRQIEQLEAPAMERGVALVHAKELGGKESRFLAPGSRAQLDDGIALIRLVARQQHQLDLLLERRNTCF